MCMINDRIFCHFGPFFSNFTPLTTRKIKILKKWKKKYTWRNYHFTHVYHTWKSYDVWFLRYGVQWTESFVILDHFLPFYPNNNPKKETFWRNEKTPGDIIILHMCTINDSHIMYGSWDMEHDGHNFLSFWTIFCTFTPLTIRKIKILKKGKKPWRYYLFTHVYDKWQSNDLWFLRYGVRWTEFMSCCAMTEFMSWIYVMLHKCTKNYDQMIVC